MRMFNPSYVQQGNHWPLLQPLYGGGFMGGEGGLRLPVPVALNAKQQAGEPALRAK
jgi:hypothetical protein